MSVEEQRLKATLKRIQNERKAGFGVYLLIPRHLLLLVLTFLFFRFLTGFLFSDSFFLFTIPFFLTGLFFFFFVYPRHPAEYYRKETSLLALTDGRYRLEFIRRVAGRFFPVISRPR